MKQISNFNGELIVKVKQVQIIGGEEIPTMFEMKIPGFKSLSLNQLAGTITKEIFSIFKADKFGKAKGGLKASFPVALQMFTKDGQLIANTAKMDKKFSLAMTLRSPKNFGMALFTGLNWMSHRAEIATLTSLINEDTNSLSYVNENDVVLFEPAKKERKPRTKKVKPTQSIQPVNGENLTTTEG